MDQLSLSAQRLWAKKSRDGSLKWLPLTMHLADSAEIARKLWNRWLPDGIKCSIAAGLILVKTAEPEESANIENSAVAADRADRSDDANSADATDAADAAEQLLVFLAAAHDIGKATPVFQAKNAGFPSNDLDASIAEGLIAAGLPMRQASEFNYASKTPHALATQILLEQNGCNRNVAVILGAHHGKPPSSEMLNNCGIGSYNTNYHLAKEGKAPWTAVQRELITFVLGLSGFMALQDLPNPNMVAQTVLSGLVIMTDWIASNETYFPYISLIDKPDYQKAKVRATDAYKQLALAVSWTPDNSWMNTDLYHDRFGFVPNAVQSDVAEVTCDIKNPGIFVLEAPMGIGKTEAALVAAEIFAYKAKRNGLFFALPTQATSDGIFPRMLQWIDSLDAGAHTIRLAHGKAQFNSQYQSLKPFAGGTNVGTDEHDGGAYVHSWFEGQKTSLLAEFVVGTIDQLLFSALKQKHVMLRHLGLANKVVIIDECHAYDAYMSRYLERALRWLGAYHVPVIVLSATLPASKRQMVIDAYLNINSTPRPASDPLGRGKSKPLSVPDWIANRSYPLLTYSDGNKVLQKSVATGNRTTTVCLGKLPQDELVRRLDDLLSEGGCAGLIVNTVRRAQEITGTLVDHFGQESVMLLHSRFLAPDRSAKETIIRSKLGKPGSGTNRPDKFIVVGTQVLEQSLDIDFDLLITEFCPMDLLLQRVGRLHRHERPRPVKLTQAHCLIMGLDSDDFDSGAKAIYGEYLLLRTRAWLPAQIDLPQAIPALVQDVYDDSKDPIPEPPNYREIKKQWDQYIADKEIRADTFRICPPWLDLRTNLVNWLNTDVPATEKHGEAAVRDTEESFEVLLIMEKAGRLYFLPWQENGRELAAHTIPEDEVAQALARQRIRLPRELCAPWVINDTIEKLEILNRERLARWQQSPWLQGELFLILDDQRTAILGRYRLTYDQSDGLRYESVRVDTESIPTDR